jgi:hypothetical protein
MFCSGVSDASATGGPMSLSTAAAAVLPDTARTSPKTRASGTANALNQDKDITAFLRFLRYELPAHFNTQLLSILSAPAESTVFLISLFFPPFQEIEIEE